RIRAFGRARGAISLEAPPKQRSEVHEAIDGGAWRSLHRAVALSGLRRAPLLHLHLRDQRRLFRQPPARHARGGAERGAQDIEGGTEEAREQESSLSSAHCRLIAGSLARFGPGEPTF